MSPHPLLQAVLLDMDGTIVDAFAPIVYAMNETFKAFDMPTMSAKDIQRHTGRGDCGMTSLFGAHKEQATQHFLQLHDARLLDGIAPIAGAEAMLKEMHRHGIPVAIVTSKGQQRAEAQIEHLGWSSWIACIVGKQDGLAEKPDPAPIFKACSCLQQQPEHCVMIGDGTADMQAAQRAGSMAIGLHCSFQEHELKAAGATHCFPNLIEAYAWLKPQII